MFNTSNASLRWLAVPITTLLTTLFLISACMQVDSENQISEGDRNFHEGSGGGLFGLPQEENEPFQKCRGEIECNSRPRLKRIAPHEQQYVGMLVDATTKEPFRSKNFDLILYRRDYDTTPAATFHYLTDSNGRFESGRIAFARGRRVRVCIKDQVQLRNSDGTVSNVVYDGTACFPRFSEEALQTSARVAVSNLGSLGISRDYFSAYDMCPTFPTVIPGGSTVNNCRKDDTLVSLIVCDREGADDPSKPALDANGVLKPNGGECRTIPNAQVELSFRQNSNAEPIKLSYTSNSAGKLLSDLIASVRMGYLNVRVTADGYLPYFSGDVRIPNSKLTKFAYKRYRLSKRGTVSVWKSDGAFLPPILMTRNAAPHGAVSIRPLRASDSQGIYSIANSGDSFTVSGYAVDEDYSGTVAGKKTLIRVIHNGQIVLERYTDRPADISCRVGTRTCPADSGFELDLMSELTLVEGLNQVYVRAFNEEELHDAGRPGATKEQRYTDLGDFDNEFSIVSPLMIYRQPIAATFETLLLNVYANTAFISYKRVGTGAADFLTLKLCQDQFGFLSDCREIELDFDQGSAGDPDKVKVAKLMDLSPGTKYVVSTTSKIGSDFEDISFETAASAPSIGSIRTGEILAEGTRSVRAKVEGSITSPGLVVPGVEFTLQLTPRASTSSSSRRVLAPIVRHFRVGGGQTTFTVSDLVLPVSSNWTVNCYQADYTTCGTTTLSARLPRR